MSNRNGTWEAVGIVFGLFIIIGVVAWFSYAKGTMDQDETDAAWINKAQTDFWNFGYKDGRREQRDFDIIVCQKHSLHPRLEDHCVAPL